MGTGQRLVVIAVMMLPGHHAAAQTLPWQSARPPEASPFGGGGEMAPCMAEFSKLREDVQKLGLAAKAAGQRKVSRQEMCKHITAYSAAELKWVNYTEANVQSCG